MSLLKYLNINGIIKLLLLPDFLSLVKFHRNFVFVVFFLNLLLFSNFLLVVENLGKLLS